MEKKKNYVVFPDGDCYGIDSILEGFDHSFGAFMGGGLFCWPNRFGKKTFANSNQNGDLDLMVVCKEDEIEVYTRPHDICIFEKEHQNDGCPHFQSPGIEDLVPFVTRLKLDGIPGEKFIVHDEESYLISKLLTPIARVPSFVCDIFYKYRWMFPSSFVRRAKSMPYNEFLLTAYWRIVSEEVKRRRGECEICGSKEHLQVHHKTYEHHGYEHMHPEDLQCLCDKCHLKVHEDNGKEK